MNRPAFTALTLTLGVVAGPVHAQQSRSFVSGLGNDGNAPNCTRTAPCRTRRRRGYRPHARTRTPRGIVRSNDARRYARWEGRGSSAFAAADAHCRLVTSGRTAKHRRSALRTGLGS